GRIFVNGPSESTAKAYCLLLNCSLPFANCSIAAHWLVPGGAVFRRVPFAGSRVVIGASASPQPTRLEPLFCGSNAAGLSPEGNGDYCCSDRFLGPFPVATMRRRICLGH